MFNFGNDEYLREYSSLIKKRRESESGPFIVTTPEWLDDVVHLIQGDEKYKRVARTWEGSCVLVFESGPDTIFTNNIYIYLDLFHGECGWGGLVSEDIGKSGDYVLYSPYSRWKLILKGELNVVRAIATGKLKLIPFDIKKAAKLAAAAQAAIRLVELTGEAGGIFPDEADDQRKKSYLDVMEELNSRFGI
jgi:putative sterol carrier protein